MIFVLVNFFLNFSNVWFFDVIVLYWVICIVMRNRKSMVLVRSIFVFRSIFEDICVSSIFCFENFYFLLEFFLEYLLDLFFINMI